MQRNEEANKPRPVKLVAHKRPGLVELRYRTQTGELEKTRPSGLQTDLVVLLTEVESILGNRFTFNGGSLELYLEGLDDPVASVQEPKLFLMGVATQAIQKARLTDRKFNMQYEIGRGLTPADGLKCIFLPDAEDLHGQRTANAVASLIDKEQPGKLMLDLSTCHMPDSNPDFGELRHWDYEEGVVVLYRERDETTPEWLWPALDYAKEVGAMLLVFDRDADECGFLPAYDWHNKGLQEGN